MLPSVLARLPPLLGCGVLGERAYLQAEVRGVGFALQHSGRHSNCHTITHDLCLKV
jgi:hypothetical protein